ncbi:MAG: hypothetical protein F4107_02085 [Gemmatimonadetes bacterium]|nr:hypothetical protein [Gemmatimonadota bacterium]MYD12091.1 hypothetical protein [Gemmatimonadota bacterium]MYI64716.1 hypothetical protein [Gemmatimonadota bacterium]
MSLFATIAAGAQLCAGCALEFEVRDTLGSLEDPAGIGTFAEMAEVGDQGYLVSSEILGGVVIVYDASGHYGRELTREGEGPGELLSRPTFAVGTDGVLMHEPGSARLHLFSLDLSFQKTFLLPGIAQIGSIQPDPATNGWLVAATGTDLREKIVFILDRDGSVLRTMPGDHSGAGWLRNVIRGLDGMIWSAGPFGLVEVYDENMVIKGSVQLELPGTEGWEPGVAPGSPAAVMAVRPAPEGAGVWVFAIAPEDSIAELSIDDMRTAFMDRTRPLEQKGDAFVYWVDLTPDGLELLGRDRFDTLVRPLGYGDLAYDIVETPDGNRRVRVGRLRFTRGEG